MRFLYAFLLVFTTITSFAQNGTIRGVVVDDEIGETLIGVNIQIVGTPIGAITDIDGSYSLSIPAGTYQIAFSYISYTTKNVTDVTVKAGEVTALDIRLSQESMAIAEVVVTAQAVQNTETALLTIQKKSANLLDGVSAQTFSRTGDGDAAAAIKRVTGVTVEGGKYVYVRGLGDRYSKSILNGMEIPGLDPERNTVQMDIFPSNIIDNIIVYKTFTPDLPGDFTGGMVDVVTKDFPLRKTFSVSASFAYDTETSFSNDFILYGGTRTDAIGFGKDSRQLIFPKFYEPSKDEPALLFATTNSLNKELDVREQTAFLNHSYSLTAGNQVDGKRAKIGYMAALNYKSDFTFRPDFMRSEVRINPSNNEEGYEFQDLTRRTGQIGIQESLWSAMLSGSVKKKNNKVTLQFLHTQSGEKSATSIYLDDRFENEQESIETDLSYTQRMISNALLSGEHMVKDRHKLTWGSAFTYTSMDQPDLTSSEFVIVDGDTLFVSGSSSVEKIFRELSEINSNSKFDYELSFDQWSGQKAKFKAGVSSTYKKRDFETYSVSIGKSTNFSADLNTIENGLNTILESENLFGPNNDEGYMIQNVQVDDENKFTSTFNLASVYAMMELPLHDAVKLVTGLRTEYVGMNYAGTDRLTGDPIDNKVLDSWQFLPAVNMVFFLTDDMNLRTSYARTLARPSFREKSESIIYDPVLGTTFYGNLDLIETNIHNADLRWEYFFGRGELFSLSGFYKKFINPIEIEPLANSGIDDIQPVNRDQADVYGFEVEFRKNFGFIHESLRALSMNANYTFVKSKIDLSEDQAEKYELVGEEVPTSRDLMGQSPYTVNAGISYNNTSSGSQVNLSYNVKGKTLVLVGVGSLPDVYEDPFHNLDFKFTQTLGKKNRGKLSLSAKNLLGDNHQENMEFLDENAGIFRAYSRGRSIKLGFTYAIK